MQSAFNVPDVLNKLYFQQRNSFARSLAAPRCSSQDPLHQAHHWLSDQWQGVTDAEFPGGHQQTSERIPVKTTTVQWSQRKVTLDVVVWSYNSRIFFPRFSSDLLQATASHHFTALSFTLNIEDETSGSSSGVNISMLYDKDGERPKQDSLQIEFNPSLDEESLGGIKEQIEVFYEMSLSEAVNETFLWDIDNWTPLSIVHSKTWNIQWMNKKCKCWNNILINGWLL